MNSYKVEEVDPTTDPRWEEMTLRLAQDVFQSSSWIRCVTEPYGFAPRGVLVTVGDQPVAGAPFIEVDGVAGHRIVVGPFSDYCDPVLGVPEGWAHVMRHLASLELPVRLRLLRFRPDDDAGVRPAGRAHWHGLSIDRDPDEILARMDASARRAIAKSKRSGVQVVEGQDLKDLRAFYDLHVDVRRSKYRLLAQPFSFFQTIWREFIERGEGRLKLAVVDGEIVAGVVFLDWGENVYYKFNASRHEALDLRPNDAIVWSEILGSYERGSRLLDFGLSDWDQEGLARYKLKFGTVADVIHTYDFGPPASVPGLSSVLGPLTEILTEDAVPRDVTVRAGELLYGQFA